MLLADDQQWAIHHGDCIPHMHEDMPAESVDCAVFSPPFPALFCYTELENDIGNVEQLGGESRVHLSYFFKGLIRVLKPGRSTVCHVMNIPALKRAGSYEGVFDFRGLCINIAKRAGFIYDGEWIVRKNPQAQAIRTRSRKLQFAGLEADRAKSACAMPDYLLKFRKPGENAVPVNSKNQVSRNQWIQWAESCWDDIIETDTLNAKEARSENDTRHICPLQLEVIRRSILLYSNPGEIVFSPFAGIGSEGFMAIGGTSPKTGKRIDDPRRFYGCELKPEYHQAACDRLGSVEVNRVLQPALF